VPQEGFLFAGTVTDNIAFGRPDATFEQVVQAAQTVGAHEFILRLEDGYETELQERGSRLSLGQRQLIALARALLADPRTLIIDKETEERIDQPASEEAERETRLTPAQAVAQMKINVPVRGNRKLRRILERVNTDTQLKAWWHTSNVNAVARMHINDHSWVHIQIVANIGLKLLRQLTKHHVQPSLV